MAIPVLKLTEEEMVALSTLDDADDDRDVEPLGMPEDSDWILYYPHPGYDRWSSTPSPPDMSQ